LFLIEPVRKPQTMKLLFIGARTFMKAAKQVTSFAIYATSTSKQGTTITKILKQYKEFQDIFEKKMPIFC